MTSPEGLRRGRELLDSMQSGAQPAIIDPTAGVNRLTERSAEQLRDLLRTIGRDAERHGLDLQHEIESLTRHLERVARRLANEGHLSVGINNLGEIQRQGQTIDLLCAVLGEDQRRYRELERVVMDAGL